MTTLYWQTIAQNKPDLVLLHGWGLNAQVWHSIEMRLGSQFQLHFVDLPGYGRSQGFSAMSLQQMADIVWQQMPKNAILLGWSLGGLVASKIAIDHPQDVKALISVASSPCFSANEEWPGIKPSVLQGFEYQLAQDFQRTVERFLALQTLGTDSARQDTRLLKSVVLEQPMPTVEVLNGGLEILRTEDLRQPLMCSKVPMLRIYGYLDGLVPRKTAQLLDEQMPESKSVIMRNAAHAPFISHPDQFCQIIEEFIAQL